MNNNPMRDVIETIKATAQHEGKQQTTIKRKGNNMTTAEQPFSRGDCVEETYYGYGQGIVAFFNGEEVDGRKFNTTLKGGVWVKFDNPSVGETWIEGEYLRKLEGGQ